MTEIVRDTLATPLELRMDAVIYAWSALRELISLTKAKIRLMESLDMPTDLEREQLAEKLKAACHIEAVFMRAGMPIDWKPRR